LTNWTRRLRKKGSGTDEKGVGTLAHQSSEGGVDLAAAAGIEDLGLRPDGARSRFQVLHYCFGVAGARVDEYGQTTDCVDQLAQKFEPLCHQLTTEKIDPRQVAARARQAGDKTEPDRVFIDVEDDRDRRSCPLGRQDRGRTPDRGDDGDLPANQ
jgi:hypothetical protein